MTADVREQEARALAISSQRAQVRMRVRRRLRSLRTGCRLLRLRTASASFQNRAHLFFGKTTSSSWSTLLSGRLPQFSTKIGSRSTTMEQCHRSAVTFGGHYSATISEYDSRNTRCSSSRP